MGIEVKSSPKLWTHVNGETEPNPEPMLPNIKITPKDLQVNYGVLLGCGKHSQDIYLRFVNTLSPEGDSFSRHARRNRPRWVLNAQSERFERLL